MGLAVGRRRGALLAVTCCALATGLPAAGGAREAGSAASVTVTLSDFAIRLSAGAVRARTVTFHVRNRGNVPHSFGVAGRGTALLSHGRSATLTVTVSSPGAYRFSSSRAGDAAIGMTGLMRIGVRVDGKADPLSTRSRLRLTPVATGLGPLTFAVSPPGDADRLMVVRQDGMVLLFENGVRRPQPFLDLRSVVGAEGEKGLLSLAFAPDYAASGRFYVYFTNRDGNIRVVERTRSASDPDVADPTHRRVLALEKATADHNGGMMQFGPDGDLYVAIGDGGADPPAIPVGVRGQTLDDLFGTILRIDPRGGAPYAIPSGNPFASQDGARPEIVAYGLRNPWRFWIDPQTNTMLIGDVGEGAREEVDRLPLDHLGLDFGWPCKEGTTVPPDVALPASCAGAALTAPLFEYPHTAKRCAITGGLVARDTRLAALGGIYLWADFCEGRVYGLTAQGAEVPLGLAPVEQPTSFGVDGAGRVYVTTARGSLYRLDVAPSA
jgi:glucose/arabinose dehydrogenase